MESPLGKAGILQLAMEVLRDRSAFHNEAGAAIARFPKRRRPGSNSVALADPRVPRGILRGMPTPPLSAAFIRGVEVRGEAAGRRSYPLNLPALRGVESLDLDPRMTIFVGENGSGKSTLIEGIAVAADLTPKEGPEISTSRRNAISPSSRST